MKLINYSNQEKFLFSYIPPDSPDCSQLIKTANQLITQYELFFSKDVEYFHLINDYSNDDYPMTRRDLNTIYVNCPLFNCKQFAYQLSHELCHWMIPEQVTDNLRWLEETIAVMSSAFFPMQILDQNSYVQYLNTSKNKLTPLCVHKISAPTFEQLKILESASSTLNFTDYGSYWNMALYLLPLMQSHISFWQAVPLLCKIPGNLTLKESLNCWLELCPSDIQNSLSQVIGSLLPR